jgi:hypothetical protein
LEAKRKGEGLVGKGLVIPPPGWSSPAGDLGSGGFGSGGSKDGRAKEGMIKGGGEKRQFIGCLFTSEGFGKRKASPEQILTATESAMGELLGWVGEWNRDCLLKQAKQTGKQDGK